MTNTTFPAIITALAFTVNITVQLTKEAVCIPTKLWTVIVSAVVTIASVFAASSMGYFEINISTISTAILTSFITAYISMYGFDMFRELYNRFKNGNNINKE